MKPGTGESIIDGQSTRREPPNPGRMQGHPPRGIPLRTTKLDRIDALAAMLQCPDARQNGLQGAFSLDRGARHIQKTLADVVK